LIFGALTFYFGGDALSGEIVGGKYYLNMKGNVVEVSENIFNFSKFHGLSVILSFSIVFGLPMFFTLTKALLKKS